MHFFIMYDTEFETRYMELNLCNEFISQQNVILPQFFVAPIYRELCFAAFFISL